MAVTTREKFLYMAKLAEQAERYEDVAQFMEEVAGALSPAEDLIALERSILSISSKNVLGKLVEYSLRVVSRAEEAALASGDASRAAAVRAYRARVEVELSASCGRALRLLDARLVDPAAASTGARVFYLKLKGDCHRHLAGLMASGPGRDGAAEAALAAYRAAQEAAGRELAAEHPLRLATALSFSVFCYEMLCSSSPTPSSSLSEEGEEGKAERARGVAKKAMDEAVGEVDRMEKEAEEERRRQAGELRSDRDVISWASYDTFDDIDDLFLMR